MVKVIGKFNPKLPQNGFSQPKPQQPQQGDSKLTTAARNVISPALSAAEAINPIGRIGDFTQGVANIFGIESEPGKGTLKVPFSSQGLRENIREPLSKYLGAERLTIPQGQLEERWNDFVGDFAALVSGTGIKRGLKIAGLGNLAGFAAHQIGASPGEESAAKLGIMLLSTLHGGRSQLNNIAQQDYEAVKSGVKDKTVNANKLDRDLDNFQKKLKAGATSKEKKDALEQALHLGQQIEGNNISAENLYKFQKEINNEIGKLRPKDPLREYYIELSKMAKDNLKPIGSELYNKLTNADEIYRSLRESDKVGSFINQYIGPESIKSSTVRNFIKGLAGVAGLGGSYGAGALTGLPGVGIAAGAGAIANESFKFTSLLNKSPQAREIVGDLFNSALKGNAQATIRQVTKLDKIASNFEQKQEPQQRVRVIGKLPTS